MAMSSPDSALRNTVAPMRRLGIFEEDGALTDLGKKWRVDGTFPEACEDIIKSVYPDELGALADGDGKPDAAQVRTWFEHKGFGGSNAKQMASTYVMIAGKELPDAAASATSNNSTAKKAAVKKAPAKAKKQDPPDEAPRYDATDPPPPAGQSGPTVHLDIQIHIPADASPDQIDQIFASMGKHLYNK